MLLHAARRDASSPGGQVRSLRAADLGHPDRLMVQPGQLGICDAWIGMLRCRFRLLPIQEVRMLRVMNLAGAVLCGVMLLLASALPGLAQSAAPDKCLAFAEAPYKRLIQRASVRQAALQPFQVNLRYLGHSTFLLTSPKGVTMATDYNDYIPIQPAPTIATMNIAHETHYSLNPDPKIKHLLKGWNPTPGTAQIHDLTEQDVRVRNIPTNLRSFGDESSFMQYGNSVFVFEVSGLCIAHLGHLHHTLTVQQLAQIGQMDVVLVPVDGSWTLDMPGTMEVLKALKAPLVIPMHYFSEFTLGRFMEAAQKHFPVKRFQSAEMVIARDRLPAKTEVWVLPPG
jgi:L-ascorbate metabolism protein UlaG (beta-lactamase superfamily)